MPSQALVGAIRLELESAGEKREPISRRDIAERAYPKAVGAELFSMEDHRAAYMAHLISLVTQMMREPLTEDELRNIRLPRRCRVTFEDIPAWICVGGSQHKKSIYASANDWVINSRLKHSIAAQIVVHANVALDISTMLNDEGAENLADLTSKKEPA